MKNKLTKNANGKYSITSIICESGECTVRPTLTQDRQGHFETCDVYIDEFKTQKDALDFIKTGVIE